MIKYWDHESGEYQLKHPGYSHKFKDELCGMDNLQLKDLSIRKKREIVKEITG